MFVAIHLFLSSILYLYNPKYFWLLILFQGFLVVFDKRRKHLLVMLFLVLLNIRTNLFEIKPLFNHPFVVIKATNESTTLRQYGFNYISVADENLFVGDIVVVDGSYHPNEMNQENASLLISHYVGRVNTDSITKVGQSIKTAWLNEHTTGKDISSKIFLNHTFSNDNGLLNLVISSGLMLSVFYSFLIKVSSLFIEKKSIRIYLIFGLLIVFGLSFGIIRILLKEILRFTKIPRKLLSIIEMTLLLLVYPSAIYTLVFWLITVFKTQNLLFDTKYRTIKRTVLLISLQLMINYEVNLLIVLFFGLFRGTSLIIFFFSLIEVFLNFSIPITMIETALFTLNQWMSNRFNIVGKMNIIIGLLILFVLIKEKKLEKTIGMVSLLFLVHYFSIFGNGGFRVIYLNVNQGDSTLLISPYLNEVFLIDTGKESEYFSLKKTLNQYGIQKINGIIITHYDNDHSGNLENLLRDYKVNQLVDQKKQQVVTNDFNIRFYLEDILFENDNDNSLVFEVIINEYSFLFTGDSSKHVERLLLNENPSLKIFVHKLGHHGSKTSTDDYFIGKIMPSFVVISSNPSVYGHPHTEVLQTVLNYNIKTFETSKHHHIEFRLNKLYNSVMIQKQILFIKN